MTPSTHPSGRGRGRPKPKLEMRSLGDQPSETPINLSATFSNSASQSKNKKQVKRFEFLGPPAFRKAGTAARTQSQATIIGRRSILPNTVQAGHGSAISRRQPTSTIPASQSRTSSFQDAQNSQQGQSQQYSSQRSHSGYNDHYHQSSRLYSHSPNNTLVFSQSSSTNGLKQAAHANYWQESYSGLPIDPSLQSRDVLQQENQVHTMSQQPALSSYPRSIHTSNQPQFGSSNPTLVERPGLPTTTKPLNESEKDDKVASDGSFADLGMETGQPVRKRHAATQADVRVPKKIKLAKADDSSERIRKVNETILADKFPTIDVADREVLRSDSTELIKHAILDGSEDAMQQLTADVFAKAISVDVDLWALVERRFDAIKYGDGD